MCLVENACLLVPGEVTFNHSRFGAAKEVTCYYRGVCNLATLFGAAAFVFFMENWRKNPRIITKYSLTSLLKMYPLFVLELYSPFNTV